jgi:mRNA-degrading endonuclease toxin of MazEF toxin-antitoxin module
LCVTLRVILFPSAKVCTLSLIASAEKGAPLTVLVELEAIISVATLASVALVRILVLASCAGATAAKESTKIEAAIENFIFFFS